MLKTDRLCLHAADKGIRIRCQRLDPRTILLEGTSDGLKFLGNLLLAQAEGRISCHTHLSPRGPGSDLFAPGSTIGLYLHKVPCAHTRRKANGPKPRS